MRTSIAGERDCLMDGECEGRKIPGAKPITLTEFLDPEERAEFSRTKTLPSSRKPCVMCRRYKVVEAYINMRAECTSIRSNMIISSYSNIVDKVGEYRSEYCIFSDSTDYQALPCPVVLHVRKWYRQVIINEITYYEQDPSCYTYPSEQLFH